LEKVLTENTPSGKDAALAQTSMDLIALIIPFLPPETFDTLWSRILQSLQSKDPAIQKRAYRSLTKLASIDPGTQFLKTKLNDLSEIMKYTETHSTAQKDRIMTLSRIVELVPDQSLHLLTTILPEVILCTKETNEKSREAAYDLVITMGKKMANGGIIKHGLIESIQQEDRTASISEYFLMVSAGLAGSSQHLISATITCLSRMLFEFKGIIF
jgi:ribosomal RNA-processing protein 12